jgi:Ca2+/Na+ antiporter
MSDKKLTTKVRWIISGVLFAIVVGIFIAMLASGHEPSLHFIGSIVFLFLFVALVIWANLASRKAKRAIDEKKTQASELFAKKDFAGAVRVWKELLPQVGEEHVCEVLPQLERAYQEMGSAEGGSRLSDLRKLYADFFDMTKRLKSLDAKGRTMRQSLADKICADVARLPEQ